MEWLADRLRELGVPEKLERERALQLRERRLEADIASVDQRIPLWDRINVLHLTPDEVKIGQLRAEHKKVRQDLLAVDAEIETQLRSLRYESIELELASQIELCLRQARRDLWHSPPRIKQLAQSLKALADRVVAQFGPEQGWDAVLSGLDNEQECSRLAREGEEAPRSWPAGYPPIVAENLRPLVARELGPRYFSNLRRQAVLNHAIAESESALEQLAPNISVVDRINVLVKTVAEMREEELLKGLEAARKELDGLSEEAREMAYRALAAYPPLGIYLRAVEARAVLSHVRQGAEETLGPEGRLVMAPVQVHRHLVLVALKRLQEAFRRAFPALRLPRELLAPRASEEGPLRVFLEQVEAGSAPQLRERALNHALMLVAAQDEASRTSKLVSPVDRLSFWKSTGPKQRLEQLGRRQAYHRVALGQLETLLVQAAREAAHELLGFRLRDRAQTLVEGVSRIHTDQALKRRPDACPVHNQEHCLRLYEALLAVFADYGLKSSYQDFLAQVAAATPLDVVVEPDPVAGYPPTSATQLAGMLAFRLQGSHFSEKVARLQEFLKTERMLASDLEKAQSEVTVWDTLNIFTVSPAEKRRDELASARRRLSPEIATLQKEVERLLGRAAECYPPAALYFSLPQVDWAIREIKAQCQQVSRRSGGRTYSGYQCTLKGKNVADQVVQRWAATLIGTYGVLPTYHALLEAWALAKY